MGRKLLGKQSACIIAGKVGAGHESLGMSVLLCAELPLLVA